MSIKQVKGVIVPRHDTAIDWSKAINFIPKKGELIVYDADKGTTYDMNVIIGNIECNIKSSDKVRFKFGDGKSNVNVLPFATTEKSGGSSEDGFTEEEIIEIIEKYSGNGTSAIIYLDTQEHIGKTLELQDVYPIQAKDTSLKIISKNRVKYITDSQSLDGITIKSTPEDGIKVIGPVSNNVEGYFAVSEIDIDVPGNYIISAHENDGVEEEDKKCYITYTLHGGEETSYETIRNHTRLTINSNDIINTEELGCSRIKIWVYISATAGQTFNTTAAQTFKVQVEYGDNITSYTPPMDETNVGNKVINIYGRNFYSGDLNTRVTGDYIEINGVRVDDAIEVRTHYIKGVMTRDNVININLGSGDQFVTTPLLEGDKFTFIYTFADEHIFNPQILHGHVDYSIYEPYEKTIAVSNIDGVCDISNLKYPYSFLALENIAANDGYAIYLRYDPALSRDWTERELKNLNDRIKQLEEIILNLSNN